MAVPLILQRCWILTEDRLEEGDDNSNISIGKGAGSELFLGYCNINIGDSAGHGCIGSGGNIAIGYKAQQFAANSENGDTVAIGHLSLINNTSALGYNAVPTASNRIHIGNTSARLEQESKMYTGFLAQEVENAALEAGFDFSGVQVPPNDDTPYSLSYAEFVVPLVKAVQEQQIIIEKLQKEIDGLILKVRELERLH
jgi:hypothetical protein